MVLNLVIRSAIGSGDSFDFYKDVIDESRIRTLDKESTCEYIDGLLKKWISKNVLKVNKSNNAIKYIFNFVFEVELNDIPLFINDNVLKMYVNWRFKIGK